MPTFGRNIQGFSWPVLAGLGLVLAAGLAWWLVQVARRRRRTSSFFLPALVFHVCLVVGSFYVYLDPGVVPQIKRGLDRIVVNTRPSLDRLRQLFRATDDEFEQVADLTGVETEGVSVGPSATSEAPRPAPPDAPLPSGPPPRRPIFTGLVAPPEDAITSVDLRQFPRRQVALALAEERVEIEQLAMAGRPVDQQLERIAVGVDRPRPTPEPAGVAARAPAPALIPAVAAARRNPLAVPLETWAPNATPEPRLDRRRRILDAAAEDHAEPIPIEPLGPAGRSAGDQTERIAVDVDRPRPAAGLGGATAVMPGLGAGRVAAPAAGRGGAADLVPEAFPPLAMAELPRLDRVRRVPDGAAVDDRAETVALAGPAAGAGQEAAPGSVRVDVMRREAGPAASGPSGAAGFLPSVPSLPNVAAKRELERLTANLGPPSVESPGGLPPRRGSFTPSVFYAQENVGLQAMFRLRQDDIKDAAIAELGGSPETVKAVQQGLTWLKAHQHDDGHWSLNRFYQEPKGKPFPGKGSVDSDTAATGFVLLPLLADGHTHQAGQYRETVAKALGWLLQHQKPDGELNVNAVQNARMYAHAIATIALCEAYGMTKDPTLREPAQRALGFIFRAQHPQLGGWRYAPRSESDTSVVGWQVMALKSAQMATLDVPQPPLESVRKWLRSVEGTSQQRGTFRYQPGRAPTPAMTAEALLCLQYLGVPLADPSLTAGVQYLLKNLPRKTGDTSYYWYYGTQVMYHLQGESWQQWNRALRDVLVQTQRQDGDLAGTWDPRDQWENQAGRIYATSLRLLMLEVYYRHLPLYRIRQP